MATTPLTSLQTQVLGLLTNCQAARDNPHNIIAAIYTMLYHRAGASDEDTRFHLQKMVDRSLLAPSELPGYLRKELGYR